MSRSISEGFFFRNLGLWIPLNVDTLLTLRIVALCSLHLHPLGHPFPQTPLGHLHLPTFLQKSSFWTFEHDFELPSGKIILKCLFFSCNLFKNYNIKNNFLGIKKILNHNKIMLHLNFVDLNFYILCRNEWILQIYLEVEYYQIFFIRFYSFFDFLKKCYKLWHMLICWFINFGLQGEKHWNLGLRNTLFSIDCR